MWGNAHIVRSVKLATCRVLEQQSLESEYLQNRSFGLGCEGVDLEFVDVVVAYNILENRVELVKDLYPVAEVGTRPFPL